MIILPAGKHLLCQLRHVLAADIGDASRSHPRRGGHFSKSWSWRDRLQEFHIWYV